MKTKRVVLGLLPGRVDVVVYDGVRRIDGRRIEIEAETDPYEWIKTLRRTTVSLQPILDELGAAKAPTTVLYRSPTQAVDLSAFAVRTPGQAVGAALLACTDSLPYSALSAVTAAAVAGRDANGSPTQTHVVAAAEREDIAEAIAQIVDELGLRFLSATPLDAAVMALLVGRAVHDKESRRGLLYVGEHTSFFLVLSCGRLLFSRRIDLGLDSLAHSLTRPIHGAAGTAQLSLEAAKRVVQRYGIPARDQIVDEKHGLAGSQVIPLLQPVLQRYIVELRQSLRFGVGETDREGLTLHLTGPGSSIKGLTELLATEVGIEASRDPVYGEFDWTEPGGKGSEIADAIGETRLLGRLNLLPRALSQKRSALRMRRWLWTGAAAAIGVIAIQTVWYQARLGGTRLQSETYASQLADLAALEATGVKLRAAIDAESVLAGQIDKEVGRRVDLRACLQELSRLTPETIRFTSMTFQCQAGTAGATLSGLAIESRPGRTDLRPFIDELRKSPLFEGVELGNVNIAVAGESRGERFDATFKLIGVPRNALAALREGGSAE